MKNINYETFNTTSISIVLHDATLENYVLIWFIDLINL